MTVDSFALNDRIESGARSFWCESGEELDALLIALDQLGYRWNSGIDLRPPIFIKDQTRIVLYEYDDGSKDCVMHGRTHDDDDIPVSDLFEQAQSVDPSAILSMLGA